jgi:hypothetical protein
MKGTDKSTDRVARTPGVLIREASDGAIMVTIVIMILAIASGILFFLVDRERDPNIGKDWWTLSFETRSPESSAFTVENHSSSTRFTYAVTYGKETIDSGEISLSKGDRKTVLPNVSTIPGRTIVIVTASDGSKKEIYRER